MIEFKLPSLGSDMDEGKLLAWHIKPGDEVRRGQVVAVVDTSKAAVDVEIWSEGTAFELQVLPGETVPVGAVLATLLEPGETPEQARLAQRSAQARAPAPAATPGAPAVPAAATAAAPPAAPARRRVSPAARKHAEDYGIDVDSVTGTGPGGAVTLQDVELAAHAMRQPPAPPDRHGEMRKAIAAAMSRSKREIPHYYLSEPVPMRQAQDWLAAANEQRPVTERLLMATLQLKAVALALKKFPDMNGFFRDGIHQPSAQAHIGVAISLRQGGLISPALHDVDQKSLDQLMRELTDLVRRARAGSLRSSEMSDPTITVTNLGEQGVDTAYGVIYPPQVALVGFGRITERPWVSGGALCVMPAVTVSLAADHRVSDGHVGGLFLADLRERLQRPAEL